MNEGNGKLTKLKISGLHSCKLEHSRKKLGAMGRIERKIKTTSALGETEPTKM